MVVGLDPEALDGLRSRIDHDVAKGLVAAAQLAIAVDGEVIVSESIGTARPGARAPLYSASKILPVVATWRLIGAGELAYDTRISSVLPWFTGGGKQDVTVDHLLLHTAGLPRAPLGPPDWFDPEARRSKMASWYVTSPPGQEFAYHATSAAWVQAEVLAAVCGTDHTSAVTCST